MNISDANTALFTRYLGLIVAVEKDDLADHSRLALANLAWMCREGIAQKDVFPIDKASRWLGFVQGCLAMRGLIDVDRERDISRPLFHEAYSKAGLNIPETYSRDK